MDIQPQHVNLEGLFHRRLFRIPQYQRAYSWQPKHRYALFDDILRSASHDNGQTHFMATIVGLRRDTRQIITDEYHVVDIVDGQQRITTLILLYKAINKALDRSDPVEDGVASDIHRALVKADDASLLLLQTNHDRKDHFANYLRTGKFPRPTTAKTLADRELLTAMSECEQFVDAWKTKGLSLPGLVGHLKNKLTFILHEISDEALVYTVFEVLNSRGLDVSWFDRLKSMLMAVVFESKTGNNAEIIGEVHELWSEIYRTIGLRLGLSTESLRFAATMRTEECPSRPLSEEDAAKLLLAQSIESPAKVIETTKWLKRVTEAVDGLVGDRRRNGVTKVVHARLVAVALKLNDQLKERDRKEISRRWESVAFRMFGMYGKDARTGVGDFVRLSWHIVNEELSFEEIMKALAEIGRDYPIDKAIEELKERDCYNGWDEELRYLLFGYEEYLAGQAGQKFDNAQWNRIWEASVADSIEHIAPQSSGRKYVHWLGNLLLLPPKLNSKLSDKNPRDKREDYADTGLFIARDVAKRIGRGDKWRREEIRDREAKLLKWASRKWKD